MIVAKRVWVIAIVSLLNAGVYGQSAPSTPGTGIEIHVSPAGRDNGPGTAAVPLRTLAAAQQAARRFVGREPVTVLLHAGTYYLSDTLVFTPEDSGTKEAPVSYAGRPLAGAVPRGAALPTAASAEILAEALVPQGPGPYLLSAACAAGAVGPDPCLSFLERASIIRLLSP
jgi:hypothetical protein